MDNLPPLRTSSPIIIQSSSPSPTLSSVSAEEEETHVLSTISPVIDSLLSKNIDNPEQVPHTVIATCPMPTTSGSSLSAATSLPYLGPTGRCKKQKIDETAEMFKETLSNLNKSMTFAVPQTVENDPDSLIGKNVELALKSLPNLHLRLQFRKKFRNLIHIIIIYDIYDLYLIINDIELLNICNLYILILFLKMYVKLYLCVS